MIEIQKDKLVSCVMNDNYLSLEIDVIENEFRIAGEEGNDNEQWHFKISNELFSSLMDGRQFGFKNIDDLLIFYFQDISKTKEEIVRLLIKEGF